MARKKSDHLHLVVYNPGPRETPMFQEFIRLRVYDASKSTKLLEVPVLRSYEVLEPVEIEPLGEPVEADPGFDRWYWRHEQPYDIEVRRRGVTYYLCGRCREKHRKHECPRG